MFFKQHFFLSNNKEKIVFKLFLLDNILDPLHRVKLIFSIYSSEMTVKSEMSADQSSRVTLRTLHQNFLAPPLGQCMVPKVLLQIPSEIKQVQNLIVVEHKFRKMIL